MAPNIIWITLDSIRADHTSMGGYHRDTTPNMNRIGSDGQILDWCFSSGIRTKVSTASNLTGTYPFYHGLGISNDYLPTTIETIPELLTRSGYTTAGLSRNSYLSAGTGLDRGFDRFEWIAASTLLTAVDPRTLVNYLLNVRKHSAGLTLDTARHATPYLMNETAKRWLQDLEGDSPFFFYLHYNEPHRPYYPPLPYLDQFADNLEMSSREAAEFAMYVHENAHELIAHGLDFTEDEMAALKAMYDAEIRYTDEMIGQLFDHVQSMDLGETIFVITADHGELLGEHGLLSHKVVVDDALTHVPMVTHGFEALEEQADELVQQVDVMRTLLELGGADTSQLQGIDLRFDRREQAYVQRGEEDFEVFHQFNPEYDASEFHRGAVTGVRTKQFRYQKSTDMTKLFALPDETRDVSTEHPQVVEQLDNALETWLEEVGSTVEATGHSELTDAMRRQLRDLGYVE